MTISAPARLVDLAAALSEAKAAEGQARADRIEIEKQIIALCEFTRSEGQETFTAEDPAGNSCQIVLKQPISTSFESAKWVKARLGVTREARRCVLTTYKLDVKKAREVQKKSPADWLIISNLVTRKPGKIGVELKELSRVNHQDRSEDGH